MDYQRGHHGHHHHHEEQGSGHGGEYGRQGYEGGHHHHHEEQGSGHAGEYGRQGYEGGYGKYGSQPNYSGQHAEAGRYNRHKEQLFKNQQLFGNESQQPFKIYCDDCLVTVKDDAVVLTPGDESSLLHQFIKDYKWGSRVQDEAGCPAFAIVHKASGLALRHGNEMNEKVTLQPYDPDTLDESVLWTQTPSEHVALGGFFVRPVGNIHVKHDVKHDGDMWNKQENQNKQEDQKWKIVPFEQA